ncbi:hypothetical protein C8R45DRAFT_1220459 [Mycena sanguinolenta]|nr:hypothetical protein C8R45DRAFT_1220459 [Mycena sanguinolenta]
MTCLGRYGITETDIQAGSFQCTSGAVCALRAARFITRIEALSIRFESSTTLDRDIAALSALARSLPPVKSIDLEWLPVVETYIDARKTVLERLLLDLVSHRSQPAIIVSLRRISVVRPHRPTLSTARRLLTCLRVRGPKYASEMPEPEIDEAELLQALMDPLLRAARRVAIRVLPLGRSLVALSLEIIWQIEFPPDIRPAEATLLLLHLNLPAVAICAMNATSAISDPALRPFFSPLLALPSGSLPQLEAVHGSAFLLSWVLASPQASPNFDYAAIDLFPRSGTRDCYHTALCALAPRPTATSLALRLSGWAPWNTPDFAAPSAPERSLHVADLHLIFRAPSRPPQAAVLVQWLRLFDGLRVVMVNQVSSSAEKLRVVLQKEFPNISFRLYAGRLV